MSKLSNDINESFEMFIHDINDFGAEYAVKRHKNHLQKVMNRTPVQTELLSWADSMLLAFRTSIAFACNFPVKRGASSKSVVDLILKLRAKFLSTMYRIAKQGLPEAIGVCELLSAEAKRPINAWKNTSVQLEQTVHKIESEMPQLPALTSGI